MGVLWAAVFLLILEFCVRTDRWPMQDWGEDFDPTFWYGFQIEEPVCREVNGVLHCARQEYVRIVDQRIPAAKSEDTLRIVTLGGSHAYGGNAYSQRVLGRLSERCPSVNWENLNLAVRGYGTQRMRVLMEEAASYQPDLWILDPGGTNEYEDERDLAYAWSLHTGPWRWILQSQLVVLKRKEWSGSLPEQAAKEAGPRAEEVASADPANQARWREGQRQNLAAMVQQARAADQAVVLMGRASLEPEDAVRQQNFALLGELAGPDVIVVDADESLPRRNRRVYFHRDRNHYSAAGHAHLSGIVADAILELPAVQRRCAAPR